MMLISFEEWQRPFVHAVREAERLKLKYRWGLVRWTGRRTLGEAGGVHATYCSDTIVVKGGRLIDTTLPVPVLKDLVFLS